jgi:hypothetical protein
MRVGQRLAQCNLSQVNGRCEGVRVAGLVVHLDLACPAFADHLADFLQVAIKEIYCISCNLQPSSAVDPRTPTANRREQTGPVLVVKRRCQAFERCQVQRLLRMVVDAQVDIRIRTSAASGARTTQHNGSYTGNSLDLIGNIKDECRCTLCHCETPQLFYLQSKQMNVSLYFLLHFAWERVGLIIEITRLQVFVEIGFLEEIIVFGGP